VVEPVFTGFKERRHVQDQLETARAVYARMALETN